MEDGEEEEATACSVKAVVADALDCEAPTVAKTGMRPTENREVAERRDAREPGRNGDGTPGALLWLCGAEPVLFIGDGGGGGDSEGVGLFASGIGPGGGTFSETPSEPAEAWANKRDNDDGRAGGELLVRALARNR